MCCPLCGEPLTILAYPNTLSTPQVAADNSIEQGHLGSGRLSAQPQDPVLQHVKRTTDSVLGQRLSSCLACSPSRQLAMPGGGCLRRRVSGRQRCRSAKLTATVQGHCFQLLATTVWGVVVSNSCFNNSSQHGGGAVAHESSNPKAVTPRFTQCGTSIDNT